MSKTNENKLVPKLRFPEFENSNEWEETTLGKITNITNGKSNAQDHIENGKYPLFDRSAIIKASNNFLFDCEAVIIPGEGMKFIPKYYKGKFDLHQRAYALKDFAVEVEGIFVYYLMMHRSDLLAKKAVKSTVLSLRLPILQNFPIQIPKVLKEQQKIAVCLSSLDEVITAESQKLDLLKEHKKGLLQNLFPQEGEIVPKLRFKEFEDSGEWDEKELGSFCINISSGKDKNVIDGEYELYGSTGIIGRTENVSYEGDFILVARVGANAGLLNKVKGKFGVTDNTLVIDLVKKDLINFIFYSLESVGLNKLVFGSGQPLITGRQLKNLLISIPSSEHEQKKIVDILSSIDDLIYLQSQKIETLKLHKKGLLQGLFPDINEENSSNSMELENDRN